jgi:hypothetical protein
VFGMGVADGVYMWKGCCCLVLSVSPMLLPQERVWHGCC